MLPTIENTGQQKTNKQASCQVDFMECGGYILCDPQTHGKVKFESPQFKAFRHVHYSKEEEVLQTLLVEIVQTNTCRNFLEKFGMWEGEYNYWATKYEAFVSYLQDLYLQVKTLNHKEYGMWAAATKPQPSRTVHLFLQGAKIENVEHVRECLCLYPPKRLIAEINSFETNTLPLIS